MKNNARIKRINAYIRAFSQYTSASLIKDSANIEYLTGFSSCGGGWLLVTASGELVYFCTTLYARDARRCSEWKVKVYKSRQDFFRLLMKVIKTGKIARLAVNKAKITADIFFSLEAAAEKINCDITFSANELNNMRIAKDKGELNNILRAAKITQSAFAYCDAICRQTGSEKALSIELEKFLRLQGDNSLAFSPIIAAGLNSSLPHHFPDTTDLGNTHVLVDMGAKYSGYCADLTRIFFLGKLSTKLRKIYDIICLAADKAVKTVRVGARAKDIDRAARDVIDKKGFGKYFVHGTGHGVGLRVHELPRITYSSTDIIKENSVITIEPGIYLPGEYGVRVECMVIVKKNKGEVVYVHGDRQY